MEMGLLSILALGFVLGIKHAIEPDHVIAVSTIASQTKKLWRSTLSGVFWGIGHTFTLFVVGIIVIATKTEIPDKWAMSLEFLVGIMLVYLGVTSISSYRKNRLHKHEHGEKHLHIHGDKHIGEHNFNTSYVKSMVIGFIHGLAGSAAMILLTMSTADNVWEGSLFILIFGVGTIIGMLFFTTILGIPFALSAKNFNTNRTLIWITGSISTVFGLYYMYNLGINEGLFNLWI